MWETTEELTAVQQLLDHSFEQASQHLLAIMTPERRLTAEQAIAELPSPAVLNLATVTAAGEPRLSAVDGHFLHGHWYFTTDAGSPKARHLRARPAVSASFTPRDGFGVFCHGRAVLLDGAEKQMLREHFTSTYGSDPEDWGSIAYVRLDASWLVAFAMTDAEMVKIEADKAAREAAR
ncbi:MAG: pyridoxamine 5'-phosphate oxidase family protein [Actinomycetota bacterium]|nr:pyridoxamine 5'-phosphate oxidase family protein [Actinomycetota bacterium]